MNSHMDPEFAAALRRTLLEQAKPGRSRARSNYRRTVFIGVGTVAGLGFMGAAAAAFLGLPGAQVETSLSAPVELGTTGRAVAVLGDAPKGANALHFEFTCTSPGTYIIDNAGVVLSCDKADVGTTISGLTTVNAVTDGSLAVSADAKGKWELRAWYVQTKATPLAKNANGETYGVNDGVNIPDLVHVSLDDGTQGYIRQKEVDAVEAQGDSRKFEVPVYQSDGKTVIGTFTWAN